VTRRHLLLLAATCAVLAALGVAFLDEPIARWVHGYEESWLWSAVVGRLEYAVGIEPWTYLAPAVMIAGVVASLTVPRMQPYARAWLYITVVYLLTRNLMGWAKLFFGRLRPHQWIDIGGSTFGHIGTGASFPSGHAVVFGGVLIPLAVVIPRTRPLLVILPFVMAARIAVQAHFLSDVCAGVTLTALVAWLCWPLFAASPARRPASLPG
jgi:membrane-associated phospholipid phosphatase